MRYTLPHGCGEVYGLYDARRCGLEADAVKEVLSCLIVLECHLKRQGGEWVGQKLQSVTTLQYTCTVHTYVRT